MLWHLLFVAAASARVMDRLAAVPKDWVEVSKASEDEVVLLRVALKQQRSAALEQAVLEMSTPGHPNYGLHMTRDEVMSYTAPSAAAISVVGRWLRGHGIQPWVDNDMVSFGTTVRTANGLLDAGFGWYEYSEGGGPKLRTLSYSVPDEVAAHVDLVQPTTRFGQLGARNKANLAAAAHTPACNGSVTPDCLKSLYNIKYRPSGGTENKIAFCSFLEEYARYSDLQLFEERYVPAAQGQNFSVELVNGGLDDQTSLDDSTEANLDIQYILGISHPIPILEYSTSGRGPLIPTADQPTPPGTNEPYLEWLTYMTRVPDSALPQAISVSYGEEEQSVPRDYALKVCNMFMQLGARGVSVLFASGDSGPGNSCIRNTDNSTHFEPTFPAGCPWVTAVGGTTGTGPEKAVTFSSGGFSSYYEQPTWQRDVVSQYLGKIGDRYSAYFNRSGRGIPDVSAQASNFAVIDKGQHQLVAGTSASAPVVAGMVILLNAARKTLGQPSLGFLNPWLYNNSAAFTDIVDGAGSGCRERKEFRNGARWDATVGWDPVTGLGTPKFDALLGIAAPGVPNA
ncbi:tripeptidyl-peptidase II [Madurella fahalii]|uniref:tripeptidyl-peptidase II n=1 Tax=Madurella fahalii TaxID=1157608 RepID=A0ABQ0G4I5_9PEZI